MHTISSALEDARIRQIMRKRWSLINQTHHPLPLIPSLFRILPPIQTALNYQSSFAENSTSAFSFEQWFQDLIHATCNELFTIHFRLHPGIEHIFSQNGHLSRLINRYGTEVLISHLLYGFIAHCVIQPMHAQCQSHPFFSQLCQQTETLKAAPFKRYENAVQQEKIAWQPLKNAWANLQISAECAQPHPAIFCDHALALHQQVTRYAHQFGYEYTALNTTVEICERLAEEHGLLPLSYTQAQSIAAIYATCLKITRNDIGSFETSNLSIQPQWMDCAKNLTTIISQFFILGVIIEQQHCSSINVQCMQQAQENGVIKEVLYFLDAGGVNNTSHPTATKVGYHKVAVGD